VSLYRNTILTFPISEKGITHMYSRIISIPLAFWDQNEGGLWC
jgi:hypothetical protein